MRVWAGAFPVEMNVPDLFPAILAIHSRCHDLLSTKLCAGDFMQLVWDSSSLWCYSEEDIPIIVFL